MPSIEAPIHVLPAPFTQIKDNTPELQLITQGAEALVYRTCFLTPQTPSALKYRPPKPYRHPILDKRLTRARILAEARVLVRCRKEGVDVPAVLGIDWEAGWIMMEWIPGLTIRRCLDQFLHTITQDIDSSKPAPDSPQAQLWDLMSRVGRAVGKMHSIGIVHGDLTTSNLMLRPTQAQQAQQAPQAPQTNPPMSASKIEGLTETASITTPNLDGSIVLIDFGLATQTVQDEDKAVDLYVLERAFGSTHPAAEPLFQEVLRVYGESYKGAKVVLRRLEDVRQRGRKKSMIG